MGRLGLEPSEPGAAAVAILRPGCTVGDGRVSARFALVGVVVAEGGAMARAEAGVGAGDGDEDTSAWVWTLRRPPSVQSSRGTTVPLRALADPRAANREPLLTLVSGSSLEPPDRGFSTFPSLSASVTAIPSARFTLSN